MDAVLVPVGGGGLIGGIAACIKHKKPSVQVSTVASLLDTTQNIFYDNPRFK